MSRFRFVDEPVQRPIRVFQAGDAPPEPQLRGWTVRERGDTSGVVTHSYRCPVHGLFDVRIRRDQWMGCLLCHHPDAGGAESLCMETCHWAGSFCGQGKSSGEVDS